MGMVLGVLMLVVGAIVYFTPSIIATATNKRAGCAIAVINLFFGWTLLGWVVSLAWALIPDEEN